MSCTAARRGQQPSTWGNLETHRSDRRLAGPADRTAADCLWWRGLRTCCHGLQPCSDCQHGGCLASGQHDYTKSDAAKTGLTYSLSCTINLASRTAVTDYKAAWATPFDLCTVGSAAGIPSAAEKAAGAVSGGKSADTAKFLYSLCATTAGHYFEGAVSPSQATEIKAALMLCPDHPKRAELEASAGSGVALEADRTSGKLVYTGKYLVGKDVQPGTWQSQGEKVEDCYWETSDAQGNIIANNFISVAPQITITVPASAAGFTVRGCSFRWIGG